MAKTRDKFTEFEKTRVGALSLRGALRGEIYPITVTTSSKTFNVPAAWKGALVLMHADGANMHYQISTDASNVAAVALVARATEANNPIDLTPAPTGCIPIANGSYREIQFPENALTFALIGEAACVARCHLAET